MAQIDIKIELENKRPAIFNFLKTFRVISQKENLKPPPKFLKFPLLKFTLIFAAICFPIFVLSAKFTSQTISFGLLFLLLFATIGALIFVFTLGFSSVHHSLKKIIKTIIKTIKTM